MAQEVKIAGALFSDVPSIQVPDSNDVYHTFVDTSDATATAPQILTGYTAYVNGQKVTGTGSGGQATITGTYNSGNLTLSTDGVLTTWFGAIEPEFLYECRWSAPVSSAANYPLTPSTSAQNLTWTTSITTTASANATIDRWGKGYHGITETLDFGTYNYVLLEDAFVKYAYTSAEASLGKVHVCFGGLSYAYHWGARPRVSGGTVVFPSSSSYGTYASVAFGVLMTGYRTAAGTFQLVNNATYGISAAAVAPSQNSTSTVKPSYFNLRTPTFGIRGHNTYMPVASYSYLDYDNTTCNVRHRLYRVPVEYGVYTVQNDRLYHMMEDSAFPAEVI